MKVVLTGASGTAGSEVLRQALASAKVENDSSVPAAGSNEGKKSLGSTSALAVP